MDLSQFDIVIGYRADDSYFSFAQDFVSGVISLNKLSEAMRLGKLGEQIVLKSKFAFSKIKYEGFEPAEKDTYYVLQYANWDISKPYSFFDEQKLMAGKEKTITFYKDGQKTNASFNGPLGIAFERTFDANLHEELAKVYNNKH